MWGEPKVGIGGICGESLPKGTHYIFSCNNNLQITYPLRGTPNNCTCVNS